MITSQKIEALAFAGKCRWSVFWTGYASTYTIPVPEGGFILLRQILYNPFYQGETKADQILNTVHQVSLSEQGSQNEIYYLWRDPLNQVQVGGAGATHFIPGSGMQIVETWATFKKNVAVDIINAPDAGGAVYAPLDSLASAAQEKTDPLGYGVTAVTPQVNFSGAELYFPTGQQRPFVATPFGGAGARDRVRYNVAGARQMQPVTAADPDRQYQFPLIGFGCWIFNIGISEYLNSGN
jgi:hypothetical protein